MKNLSFFVLCGMCSLAGAQTISSNTLNAGSLNGENESGYVTSSIGGYVGGMVYDEDVGSVSQGFNLSYVDASTPVQLISVARAARNSWSDLLGTGQDVEVCNLNGALLTRLPAGLSQSQLITVLHDMTPGIYLLRSGAGNAQVRMIFSPNRQ